MQCTVRHKIIHTQKMNLSTVKSAQWDKTQSRELLGLLICVCSSLCTIVAHNTAQNRPDNFLSCPPDNHHCSDDVYLSERGGGNHWSTKLRCSVWWCGVVVTTLGAPMKLLHFQPGSEIGVTICAYTIWVCNQPSRLTQPSTLSGMKNEYRPQCDEALRLRSKGRMAHSTVD